MSNIIKVYSISSQIVYENVLRKLSEINYKPLDENLSFESIRQADYISRKRDNKPLNPLFVIDEETKTYSFWTKDNILLMDDTKIEYLNNNLNIEIKNEHSGLKSRSYYNSENTKENCHNLKELYTEQTYNPEEPQNTDYIKAKTEIADYFIRQNIFDENSILIPAPQHTGKAEYTKDLCNEICFHTHSKILDCLQCKPHKTLYEQKKNNEKINVEMSLFDLDENLEQKNVKDFSELTEKYYLQGKNIYFIDNVMSTGYTFNQASKIIPGIIPAPYAIGNFVNIQYKDGKYMAKNEIENLEKENKEIGLSSTEFKLKQNINEDNISDEMDKYIEMMNVNHGMSEHDMIIDMELSNDNEDDFEDEYNTVYDFLTWHEIKDKKGYLEEPDGKHNIEYNLIQKKYKLSDKEGWKDFEKLPFPFNIEKFKDYSFNYYRDNIHKTNPDIEFYVEDFTNKSKYEYKDLLKGLSSEEIKDIYDKAAGSWNRDISLTFNIMDFEEADKEKYYPEDRNKVMLKVYSELEDCNYHTLSNLLLERNYEEAHNYVDFRGYSNITDHISSNHTKYDNLMFGVNGKDFNNLTLLNEYKGNDCKIYTDAIFIKDKKADISDYLNHCIKNMLSDENFDNTYKNNYTFRLAFDTAKKVRTQIGNNIDNPFTEEQKNYIEKHNNTNVIYNEDRKKYEELYNAAQKKFPDSMNPLEDAIKYISEKNFNKKIESFENARKQYIENNKIINKLNKQLETMKKSNELFINSVKDILSANRINEALEINDKIINNLNENQKLLIIERIEQNNPNYLNDNKSKSTNKKGRK